MARKPRVEYPGTVYHVMNRGNRREAIFRADKDREMFVTTLGEACGKTGWEVLALCLVDINVNGSRQTGGLQPFNWSSLPVSMEANVSRMR
jgi:hypothetical protein